MNEQKTDDPQRVINDFSINVGTVNGSGSQTANNVVLRALFQMGIPVSGKNLFPSNIQGLPTWFSIRVSKDGWQGRTRNTNILVAMNAATAEDDVRELPPGAVCISPDNLNLTAVRTDLIHYQVPFNNLVKEVTTNSKLRNYVINMLYVGVLAHLLDIEQAEVEKAVLGQFKNKAQAAELNIQACRRGAEWAAANLKKVDPYAVKRMNENEGKILIDGNAAAAIGAMFGGVSVVTWYPITPSSSVCESLTAYLEKYRIIDGKPTFAVVQAEDEIAAIGMALGAGWAGARSMTATSGPGISLMSEFIGLGYFAEIPAVIVDVQRVGPSTGLPTRTAQGDLISTYLLSHGDTKHIVLLPGTVEECYSMTMDALDLAERFQTPVFVLSDLDLGMNIWASPAFKYPEKELDRGKVLTREDLDRLGRFERYRDVDGDGVTYRTLPGTQHPLAAYFTRGTGHNEKSGYTERPADYTNLMARLDRKFETAHDAVPEPELDLQLAQVGIIACGTSHQAVEESRHQLSTTHGINTSYLRVRALPFSSQIGQFIDQHKRIYVIDQNRDGQLLQLLTMEYPKLAGKLRSVRHFDGLPLDAESVTAAITEQEGDK